jgi:hypothetical protein
VKEVQELKKEKITTKYRKGEAFKIIVEPPQDEKTYILDVYLLKNLKGHISGRIKVINNNGDVVLECVYRKMKVRRVRRSSHLIWAVKKLLEKLKVPVKRYNVKTGEPI